MPRYSVMASLGGVVGLLPQDAMVSSYLPKSKYGTMSQVLLGRGCESEAKTCHTGYVFSALVPHFVSSFGASSHVVMAQHDWTHLAVVCNTVMRL